MKKLIFILLSLVVIKLAFPIPVFAHCPLCVAGAAVGLSLSRLVGVDDAVTGVWMAAFLGAMSLWTTNLIKVRAPLPFLKPLVYILIFGLTIWSFYKFNLIPRFSGEILGVHKLTFGMIIGGIVFYLTEVVDDLIIAANKKVFFPYQRVVVSLGSILVLSFAMFYLVNFTNI